MKETPYEANKTLCHLLSNFILTKSRYINNKRIRKIEGLAYLYLRFSSHRWRHHVWGQSCRWVLASLLLLDQPHGQCELLRVQFSLLINVAKIPENVQVIVSFLAVKIVLIIFPVTGILNFRFLGSESFCCSCFNLSHFYLKSGYHLKTEKL